MNVSCITNSYSLDICPAELFSGVLGFMGCVRIIYTGYWVEDVEASPIIYSSFGVGKIALQKAESAINLYVPHTVSSIVAIL